MASSIYEINKGVSKPVEFKGFLAQYIWYLGVVVVATLILFAVIYIAGVNAFICVIVALAAGGSGCYFVFHLSKAMYLHLYMFQIACRRSSPLV